MRHSLIHTPSLCFGKSVDCVFHTWCDLLCRNRSGTTFFGAWVSLRTFFTEGKMSEFGFLNLGYNNEGYNKKGFDRQGYDRDGYNKFGFNKEGFNRKGFDKYGYDRTGFDEQGYNASGFDKSGYDKQGYDKDGYDRLGRDRQGYDKTGYDINGFDRFGFDGSGYNRDGYDRNGLNHDGYDKYGYDVNGFDTTGYNRLGYDKFGFNCNGFNKFGFDRDGYNKDGFNKDGFNRDGFGRDGYNYSGFDKFGFDRQGYDKSGYNKDGFNRDGYTADGYNIYGYDRFGYDIMAYSSELNKNQKQYLDLFNDNDYFYALKQQIESFIDLCKNGSVRNRKEKGYSLDDVAKILAENRRLLKGLESLYKFKLIIEYFLQNNCFIGHEVYTAVEKSTSVDDIAENCKQYFPFLNVVLSNFELVEAQLASQCSNRTKAIESILNTLYIHGKITNKSEVLNIFEGLRTTSTKNANAYLALINKVLQQNEDISFKISVLEDLKNNGWLLHSRRK